jgi:F0F1-type ATP synthase beta subunit
MSPHVHRPTARSSSTLFAYCGMQHTEGKDDFATTSATETMVITGQMREQAGLRPQIVVTCFYYFLLTV